MFSVMLIVVLFNYTHKHCQALWPVTRPGKLCCSNPLNLMLSIHLSHENTQMNIEKAKVWWTCLHISLKMGITLYALLCLETKSEIHTWPYMHWCNSWYDFYPCFYQAVVWVACAILLKYLLYIVDLRTEWAWSESESVTMSGL